MEQKKNDKLKDFDPNGIGVMGNGIYGLPFTQEDAKIILLGVPWDVTTSYHPGASEGPKAILEASVQVELHKAKYPGFWKNGIAMVGAEKYNEYYGDMVALNDELRVKAERYIAFLENGGKLADNEKMQDILQGINTDCRDIHDAVENCVTAHLAQDKLVGLIGGDHSVSLGIIRALAKKHPEGFDILHIDAHADLRKAYLSMEYSHASIMYNVSWIPQVENIVQVGIRDVSEEEERFALSPEGKIVMLQWEKWMDKKFTKQTSWDNYCERILCHLKSPKVYISFDIDGLRREDCPNTGTAVPGGLSYDEAIYLLNKIAEKKDIIGFDLVEVAPDPTQTNDWDANVGARLVYHLCACMHHSQKNK